MHETSSQEPAVRQPGKVGASHLAGRTSVGGRTETTGAVHYQSPDPGSGGPSRRSGRVAAPPGNRTHRDRVCKKKDRYHEDGRVRRWRPPENRRICRRRLKVCEKERSPITTRGSWPAPNKGATVKEMLDDARTQSPDKLAATGPQTRTETCPRGENETASLVTGSPARRRRSPFCHLLPADQRVRFCHF